jgi:hypothetical protein
MTLNGMEDLIAKAADFVTMSRGFFEMGPFKLAQKVATG